MLEILFTLTYISKNSSKDVGLKEYKEAKSTFVEKLWLLWCYDCNAELAEYFSILELKRF